MDRTGTERAPTTGNMIETHPRQGHDQAVGASSSKPTGCAFNKPDSVLEPERDAARARPSQSGATVDDHGHTATTGHDGGDPSAGGRGIASGCQGYQ